jgi:hypothetical protein
MIQIFQKTGGILGLEEIPVIKTVISLFYIISIKNKKEDKFFRIKNYLLSFTTNMQQYKPQKSLPLFRLEKKVN